MAAAAGNVGRRGRPPAGNLRKRRVGGCPVFAGGGTAGGGSGVREISFCDCNGDGCLEFAAEWTLSDSGNSDRLLTVYSVTAEDGSPGKISSLASVQTDFHLFGDFTGNGADELFYTCHNSSADDSPLYAQLLDFNTGSGVPEPVTRIDFNSDVSSAAAVLFCKTDGGIRFFVDTLLSDGCLSTEVIDFSGSQRAFVLPLRQVRCDVYSSLKRQAPVFCRDKDNDGVPEIPVEIPASDGSVLQNPSGRTVVSLIEWCGLTDEGLTGKTRYFINFKDGYSVCIDKLYESTVIGYDETSGTARWYKAFTEEQGAVSQNIIFSVICSADRTSVSSDDGLIVVVTRAGEEMNIKPSFVKSLIETD